MAGRSARRLSRQRRRRAADEHTFRDIVERSHRKKTLAIRNNGYRLRRKPEPCALDIRQQIVRY